jgi:hypothetical protein
LFVVVDEMRGFSLVCIICFRWFFFILKWENYDAKCFLISKIIFFFPSLISRDFWWTLKLFPYQPQNREKLSIITMIYQFVNVFVSESAREISRERNCKPAQSSSRCLLSVCAFERKFSESFHYSSCVWMRETRESFQKKYHRQ